MEERPPSRMHFAPFYAWTLAGRDPVKTFLPSLMGSRTSQSMSELYAAAPSGLGARKVSSSSAKELVFPLPLALG